MTATGQDITTDFYAGNSKIIRVVVLDDLGDPKPLSGAEIAYAMITDAGIVVFMKHSVAGNGEIEITNPSGGEFVIKLKQVDTALLSGTYRHQANVVDSNGDEETVMVGKVNISKSYAHRMGLSSKHAFLAGI